jgi:hypothetical protein
MQSQRTQTKYGKTNANQYQQQCCQWFFKMFVSA